MHRGCPARHAPPSPIVNTIDELEPDIITQINVFTVAPEKQQALVDLLDAAAETSMKDQPGFISANNRTSDCGNRVISYAQWRSKEDLQAMHDDPRAAEHMKAAADLAEFEPIVCEVRSSSRP